MNKTTKSETTNLLVKIIWRQAIFTAFRKTEKTEEILKRSKRMKTNRKSDEFAARIAVGTRKIEPLVLRRLRLSRIFLQRMFYELVIPRSKPARPFPFSNLCRCGCCNRSAKFAGRARRRDVRPDERTESCRSARTIFR
jgi:hypothetical protein